MSERGYVMNLSKKWRVSITSEDVQTKIRIPSDMLQYLKECALDNARSFNSELIVRLAQTLGEENVVNLKNKENSI
ncbi:MAG: Arc family DNA-binding protein [Rickettsiaceae bacterium]|nr:Arc family DNA-binding protein [Rickettsiaceae bacterium]